jgi:type II secretory pathway component PulJ
MRISLRSAITGRQRRRGPVNGFAVLVVLVLLAIMASLAIGNNVALGHLKRELQLLERRQQRHHENIAATNASAASAPAAPQGAGEGSP